VRKFLTLDLHGTRHEDGEERIEKFITDHFATLPVKIVTGHSDIFIEQTERISQRHGLKCRPERWHNRGCWVVFNDPDAN